MMKLSRREVFAAIAGLCSARVAPKLAEPEHAVGLPLRLHGTYKSVGIDGSECTIAFIDCEIVNERTA